MTWLFQPLPLLFLGVIVEAVLFAVMVRTGRGAVMYVMAAAAVLFGGLILIERLVVTETEKVEQTLYRIKADLERNDHAAVLDHFASKATAARKEAEFQLSRAVIDEVKITRIWKIQVDADRNPPTAVVELNVVAAGHEKSNGMGTFRAAQFFVVTFVKEDGRWRIRAYQMEDVLAGQRKYG